MLESTRTSGMVILSTFLLAVCIMYLVSPSWIQKLDKNGKPKNSGVLILSYSLTFSMVCGTISLIFLTSRNKDVKKLKFPAPSLESARAYTL